MKCMVVYSSRTGNTEMIAKAVLKALPENSEIYAVEEAPAPDDYDFIAVGAWVDKGMPDEKAQSYMQKIKHRYVGIFMTLGAYPDSDHALQSMVKARDLLKGNRIIGTFICQGKVAPELVNWMESLSRQQPDHPHMMDAKRRTRLAEAAKHPNEGDCLDAANAFASMISKCG